MVEKMHTVIRIDFSNATINNSQTADLDGLYEAFFSKYKDERNIYFDNGIVYIIY